MGMDSLLTDELKSKGELISISNAIIHQFYKTRKYFGYRHQSPD